MADKNIVLGIDFSDCSRNAGKKALEMAELMQAKLILVHAFVHINPAGTELGGSVPPISFMQAQADMDTAIEINERWAQKLRAQGADVEVFTEEGSPHKVLIEAARQYNAELIVVGTHGKGLVERLLLGSVAHQVAQKADRPVLIVPLVEETEDE